ncbi:MAG TPA: AmmeMemoRadiSam system protein B [Armatimonadota bacterium]|nr:AmmeMemoRadiSam system protein B [Armatimonadota bacterium]
MSDQRPKLRPVEAFPSLRGGRRVIVLRDAGGLSERTVAVAPEICFLLTLLDGTHTLREVQVEYARASGQLLLSDQLERIVRELDANLLLEGDTLERFAREQREEFARLTVRPASHAGKAYPADAGLLREQLRSYFAVAGINNPVADEDRATRPAALMAPHIDFARGGPCYAHAYRHLAESAAPAPGLLVIFGTAHSAPASPYVLTRKDFATPFGLVRTDARIMDALEQRWPPARELYRDELSHRGEHSVEFQVVFAQYALGAERMPPMIPILCAPVRAPSPREDPQAEGFLTALRAVLQQHAPDACLIAGADLSHIGQRFGDRGVLTSGALEAAERGDRRLLACAEEVDADGLCRAAREETGARNVCGVPPIYALLRVTGARAGRLLRYEQALERPAQSMVSFAAMVFR